jgi:hypothetical protein
MNRSCYHWLCLKENSHEVCSGIWSFGHFCGRLQSS